MGTASVSSTDGHPQRRFDVRTQVVSGSTLLLRGTTAFRIDGVGNDIWRLCDGTRSVADIARELTEEYDVEYEQALADCRGFVAELRERDLIA